MSQAKSNLTRWNKSVLRLWWVMTSCCLFLHSLQKSFGLNLFESHLREFWFTGFSQPSGHCIPSSPDWVLTFESTSGLHRNQFKYYIMHSSLFDSMAQKFLYSKLHFHYFVVKFTWHKNLYTTTYGDKCKSNVLFLCLMLSIFTNFSIW